MTGITSITFRQLTTNEIIALVKQSGLDGIEWGGDIHVKPGDTDTAKAVGEATRAAGLRVLSYGSYLHVDGSAGIEEAFAPVLASALALGAPIIRVWPGGREPAKADENYYADNAKALRILGELAAPHGITVATEYHRGTLTENAESALKLMSAVNCPNVGTYWQPNPDISFEDNCREAAAMKPFLVNTHVFQWTVGNVRYPLADGNDVWPKFLTAMELDHSRQHAIIEFVKDDSPERFLDDAATLLAWTKEV